MRVAHGPARHQVKSTTRTPGEWARSGRIVAEYGPLAGERATELVGGLVETGLRIHILKEVAFASL